MERRLTKEQIDERARAILENTLKFEGEIAKMTEGDDPLRIEARRLAEVLVTKFKTDDEIKRYLQYVQEAVLEIRKRMQTERVESVYDKKVEQVLDLM